VNTQRDFDAPAIYEIRVEACLTVPWSEWFDGFLIEPLDNGESVLIGSVVDQAALHGLLCRVRDLGLPLLSLRRLSDDESMQGDCGDARANRR